jgi:hypothetical protein
LRVSKLKAKVGGRAIAIEGIAVVDHGTVEGAHGDLCGRRIVLDCWGGHEYMGAS